MLLVMDGDLLAGIAIVFFHRDYCLERLGFIDRFYVRKPWRGTAAARGLAAHAVEWFQRKACRTVFVTATAHLSANRDRQFVNLFRKFGFAECGPTMMKDLAP
jgi:GNAT superfamily N-acetyltransferase